MILKNEVYQWDNRRFRILRREPVFAVWIDIDDGKALPEIFLVEDFDASLQDGEVKRIEDPFASLIRIPEKGSPQWERREKAWSMIKDVVDDLEIFQRKKRGRIVQRIMVEHGVTKQTVYKYLRRFWQRGLYPNSLVPDYANCGAKGKPRKRGNVKLGRPRGSKTT